MNENGKAIPPAGQPPNRRLCAAVCVGLALAVWAVFGQTLRYGFVNYDDDVYVYENPVVTRGLTGHGVAWAFSHVNYIEWFPLTVVSHMLDWRLYGPHPGGHHLTNVLLHAATAILLFLALRKMTGALWPAAFAAAVFAIHPLRVESVAWVAERKDVLSGLFFMLTLWAYARYAGQFKIQNSRFKIYYGLALLWFTLGLLAKSMLVTMPFVLLLLDYWPLNRLRSGASDAPRDPTGAGDWSRLVLEKIPFLLLSLVACVGTLHAQRSAINAVPYLALPWRLANAAVACADYLWQMICPANLAVLYPNPGNQLPIWSAALAALALLIISAGAVFARRGHPYLLIGWLWYLVMLVPVIGFVQVGNQAHADRYTYLPQIGLYILAAWGAAELSRRWRHRRAALGLGAAAILAGLGAGAYAQTRHWRDSVSLWTHTLDCTSNNFIANNNLGHALAGQGRLDEAIQHYQRALLIKPDYEDAENNLGAALADQGKLAAAAGHYQRALQLNPADSKAHYNLGNALAGQGNMPEAIAHYERSLELNPGFAEAEHNLATALASQGRFDDAAPHYERAIELKPDFATAHFNLGNVLAAQGKLPDAAQQFQQALDLANSQNNAALADAARSRLLSIQPGLR